MERVEAALGITPRSSSAVLVAVSGSPGVPRLLDRRLIELVDDDLPAQAYHAAAALDLPEAEALIDRWGRRAVENAANGIVDAVRVADAAGCRVVAASIVGEVRDMPSLAATLRSHPLLHAGEGQLSREVIAEAAERAGLVVHHLSPRGPHDTALGDQVGDLGRAAGPPWRKEHKIAAVAARTALTDARHRSRRE